MPAEAAGADDFLFGAQIIPDMDDLQDQLDDGDLVVEADVDAGGGAGGGGGGGGLLSGILGAEGATDIMSGAGGAGMFGKMSGMIGGLSTTMLAVVGLLAGAVAFLAMLEPIQVAIGHIWRAVQLFFIPVFAALTPLMSSLNDIMGKVVNFLRNPMETIKQTLLSAVEGMANAVVGALNQIPGVSVSRVNLTGQGNPRQGIQDRTDNPGQNQGDLLSGLSGAAIKGAAGATPFGPVVVPWLSALSDEGKKEKMRNRESQKNEGSFIGDLWPG